MTRLFLLFLLSLSANAIYAQEAQGPKRDLAQRVQHTARALQLDELQTAKLEDIYARENAQLEQIAPLKTSDPDKYTHKLQAIRKGTAGSIRLLLRDEQIALYRKLAAQWRMQEHQLRRKMEGSSELEIQEALIGNN
ncbi:MAG TPA: hypothetical protein ENJ88_01190 [Phaeodactylibacter sp.]|nr:hypothetical protein [Phaeodactylibacter sp.]